MVGTWKLQWIGPDIYWQIRADGHYRSFGTGARPNEHWGRMTAAAGRFSSRWRGGEDGGSYSVDGAVLSTTGKLGRGSWTRLWQPGHGGQSQSNCPLVEAAVVEEAIGSPVRGRAMPTGCDFHATLAGAGEVRINVLRPTDYPAAMWFERDRRCLQRLTSKCVAIEVGGIGDRAFLRGQSITVLKGNTIYRIQRKLSPAPDDDDTVDLVQLGKAVAR
ncbi:hypothetical protein [Elioraea sp.]|uniref:hypothetical protein n=1 Tax=Elioraea sp. TaxID=2185103 RepID=UPI00307D37FD